MTARVNFYLALAILSCCFSAQAIAEQFPFDHNWIVKVGDGGFGLAGFDGGHARTYLVFGSATFEIPLPFFTVVGGVLLIFVVGGISLWCITSRHCDRKA